MIVSLSMVKNEADIIEAFVRHNIQFLDLMLIADNDSSDGTGDILRRLQAEGLPIVIFDDPIFGYYQSAKMSFLYKRAIETFAPRYVVPLDADEFLSVLAKPLFRARLLALRPGTQGLIPWHTYVLPPEMAAESMDDPPRRMRFRIADEHSEFRLVMHKAIIAVDPSDPRPIVIAPGNHNVRWQNEEPLPMSVIEDVALAHFPVRGLEQLTAKMVTGWIAYLGMQGGPPERCGSHKAALYARIVDGPGLSADDAYRESLRYAGPADGAPDGDVDIVEDPLNATYTLRYGENRCHTAVSAIARTWERLMVPNRRLQFTDQPVLDVTPDNASSADTAFDPQWHANNFSLDLPPFRHIAERHRPQSVLDVGCGLGGYLKYFRNVGVGQVAGIDGFPANASILIRDSYRQHDVGEPIDLDQTFDLVMCMEVIEHIPKEKEDVVVHTIARHAGTRIVFSAAEPGQPGIGHINCQPIEHWLVKFQQLGWTPNLFDTLAMRALATYSWFRRNTVVLVRDGDGQHGIDTLSALAARRLPLTNPPRSVITHPFFELTGS